MTNNEQSFADRTVVVSGASRGIGLAIALGAARRGANVVLLAKTAEPHAWDGGLGVPPFRFVNHVTLRHDQRSLSGKHFCFTASRQAGSRWLPGCWPRSLKAGESADRRLIGWTFAGNQWYCPCRWFDR